AAQSAAASVNVSPCWRRRLCAVLYGTSQRWLAWSFLKTAPCLGGAKRVQADHCEIGARAARPGKTPSTSCASLTTATPFTNTNWIPSEYCVGFSYVALSI